MTYSPGIHEIDQAWLNDRPIPQAEVLSGTPNDEADVAQDAGKYAFTNSENYQKHYDLLKAEFGPSNSHRPLSAGYKIEVSGGQAINARVTVPFEVADEATINGHPKVIIKLPPWSNDSNDDCDVAEAAALAHTTGARVVSVGFPGIAYGATPLSHSQKGALAEGDFTEVAVAQLQAALKAYKLAFFEEMPEEVTLFGSSQGASNAAAMARLLIEGGVKVENLVMGSDVALRKWAMKDLIKAYFTGAGSRDTAEVVKYSIPWRDNADKDLFKKGIGGFFVRMILRPIGHIWPAKAIAKGTDQPRILALANDFPELPMDVWGGELDDISLLESRQALVDGIRNRSNFGSRLLTLLGMPHAITSDITAISLAANTFVNGENEPTDTVLR